MNFSRLSSFGTGQFTKPVYLFCLVTLCVSLILSSFILTGCTSSAPGIRKFHLLSLTYLPDASNTTLIPSIKSALSADKSNVTFNEIRIGYRGICIETEQNGWECDANAAEMYDSKQMGGDPLDLLSIADIYQAKISFSLPLWTSVICIGVAWLMVAINILPIPIPELTRKIGAAAAAIGTLALCGAMTLQQVTTGAVHTLVHKMGMGVVEVDVGNSVIGFGWAAFALALVGSAGFIALVVADMAVTKVRARVEVELEKGVEKASGGRVNVEDVRGFKGTFDTLRGGNGNGPTKPADAAQAIASKIWTHSRRK